MRTTNQSSRSTQFSSSRSRRRPVRPLGALAVASAAFALLATGCSTQDATCGGDEYPVLAVNSTGDTCVNNGEEPPKGYARYPEGKVPEHMGDTWDKYWETRTLDENGKIVKAPDMGK